MGEALYHHDKLGDDSHAVQYREYYSGLKCRKELHIDLISPDYLVVIKLSSSHASIGSIYQAVRQDLKRGSFTWL